MNTRIFSAPSADVLSVDRRPSMLERFARRMVLSRLEKLEVGQLVISEGETHLTFGQLTREFPITAQLRVNSPAFYTDLAFGGSIGAGEGYMQGY